ncbi:MAG: bifunctional hydroxymethylpyrimidine kinase/phosphomethylpyrimidine kinase [Acidobacteria bacterium]|nr:bifunctional hydroxymethylpyrimidine kinase/phosphomethylpyrimidine kinase [Acidobacteriota bacterium]
MKTAMTIAGSDSGGGAGIQADLKTFAAHGVYGTTAITAITAQNTVGVSGVVALSTDIIIAQIEAIASDIGVDAVKTGMLANAAIVEAVAAAIDTLELSLVVVDPVMIAKSGDRLLEDEAVAAVRTVLLSRAFVVTPNAREAEVLAGIPIASQADAREAARRIHALGPGAVIIKGGHLEGPEVIDLLFDGRTFHEFRGPRIESRNTHGTGCTFSAAIAANLALGRSLPDATERAKHFVARAIRHGLAIGHGHGPLDHFWNGVVRQPLVY